MKLLKDLPMADNKNPKPSLFEKIVEAGHATVDAQIMKAKASILNANIEDDFFYSKAMVEDPSYSLHSQGWKDKPHRLQNGHLKQMSYQDSAVAAVIQTRQNQIAHHAKPVESDTEKGFKIELENEKELLEEIKQQLKDELKAKQPQEALDKAAKDAQDADTTDKNPGDNDKSDDEVEQYDWELQRKAQDKLNKQFEKAKKRVQDYILNCGLVDNRPFETKKWNFEAALRAWTRDTLTYDFYTTEKVPDRAGRLHHWFPIDAGTIKFASRDLKKYKDMAANFYNIDILYPERTEESAEKQKVIELKQELLDKDAYKFVQVVRGKVERAYTADELAAGIRNVNTDIYNNGYGISELELLVGMVTGHLNAEYYNQAYFTQGFSAKGILHIKAAINRRKLETVRTQWQHMLKGARNSFQTPIFAGVEEVNWIPLTQNHQDIGFEGWMRYVVTMLCAIYQIDPVEIGIHFKGEGGGGGGLNNPSDTKEKAKQSKDKGLYPLLKHFERYINEEIIKPFDKQFVLKFTGIDGEDKVQALDRQKEEVKFKKTVNEIRAEDGLPPLPGMDDVILDTNYMSWYNQYSDQAKELSDKNHENTMEQQSAGMGEEDPQTPPEDDIYGEGALNAVTAKPKPFKKSLKKAFRKLAVSIYKIEK